MKITEDQYQKLIILLSHQDLAFVKQGLELVRSLITTPEELAMFHEKLFERPITASLDMTSLLSLCKEYSYSPYLAFWVLWNHDQIDDRALLACYHYFGELPDFIDKLEITSLDWDEKEVGKCPRWIGELGNLEELKLGYMEGEHLPKEIGTLKSLKSLVLLGSRIVSLPENIGSLSNLEALDLWVNWLERLPESICDLTKLTFLHLEANSLTSLPENIGNLTNLKQLYLSSNELTQLPASLGELTNLTFLNLRDNPLECLPTNLITMHIDQKQLENLHHQFCHMKALTSLDISCAKLSVVPDSIGELVNLTTLSFSSNELTDLPESIGKLKNLRELVLRNNKFSSATIEKIAGLLPDCQITS